jgi:signal transduction histidine kinase
LGVLVEQLQPLAETKNIAVVEAICPELFIQGNPDYLTSLFLNLLDNAIKYTASAGQVTVEAKREGRQVRVAVMNKGAGIPTEHIPHLFDRFYRVEDARSRSTGGAGLGLAIAYEIARLHGGSITVQSQVNQTTTFTVLLPELPLPKKV